MTEAEIPEAAVAAVLDDWQARYAAGEPEFEPDPAHETVVRDALAAAAPHLAARALRDAADEAADSPNRNRRLVADWLRERADRLEAGRRE